MNALIVYCLLLAALLFVWVAAEYRMLKSDRRTRAILADLDAEYAEAFPTVTHPDGKRSQRNDADQWLPV